ncbi:MAG: transposase [Bacteroidota bacterium]
MKYENEKYYHVYNRGANRQNIFLKNENYEYCINLLLKYSPQYHVSIFAYCLMPNYYHLLLRQNGNGSIGRFIQTVFNSYTQAFNKITSHSGT